MRKLSFVLILLVTLLVFCISCNDENYSAEPTASVWDGESTDTSWYSEEGTEFHIKNASELKGLSDLVASGNTFSEKTIILDADIDLNNNEWTPIGGQKWDRASEPEKPFCGIFDGKGHSISNLKIDYSEDDTINMVAGFFGVVSGKAEIRNLNIESGSVVIPGTEKDNHAAGLVGMVFGDNKTSVLIENCTNRATVKGRVAGGILGRNYSSSTVVGGGSTSTISGCYNYGVIEGYQMAGGIQGGCGSTSGMLKVEKCENNGPIKATSKATGQGMAGGIAGQFHPHFLITECTNNGDVESYRNAAGIIGYIVNDKSENQDCCVSSSINNGTISSVVSRHEFVGRTDGQVKDIKIVECKNTGKLIPKTEE